MKKIYRGAALVLSAVMAVSLTACSQGGTSGTQNGSAKDYVYKEEVISENLPVDDVAAMVIGGDRIYATGYLRADNSNEYKLFSMKTDGTDVVEYSTEQTENLSVLYSSLAADDSGNLYLLREAYYMDETGGGVIMPRTETVAATVAETEAETVQSDTEETETGSDETEGEITAAEEGTDVSEETAAADEAVSDTPENTRQYHIVKMGSDGNELWRKDVNELLGTAPEDYVYLNYMLCDKEGHVIAVNANDGQILVISPDGELEKSIAGPSEGVYGMYRDKNGDVLISTWTDQMYFCRLDVDGGKILEEKYALPRSNIYNIMSSNGDFDLYVGDGQSVYGWNLGDADVTELLDYLDSDIENFGISSLQIKNKDEFYGVKANEDYTRSSLVRYTKVDPKDVKDKTELNMAVYGLGYDVRKQVVAFNKASDTYRIRVTDYANYDTADDYTAGITKLNTDIAAGQIADIVLLNNSMPVDSYISKGLFEDLNPYLEKDEELSRSDFLENILDIYSRDGKLYSLIPSFTVVTAFAKTADVGTAESITLDEVNALLAEKPEGTVAFPDMTRDSILSVMMQVVSGQFIDAETGQCSFNSQDFVSLLEFVNTFPKEINYDDMDAMEDYYNNRETIFRDGRALFSYKYMTTFSDYNYSKKGEFGEDITIIGFPSSNGNGSAVLANMQISMSSKSKNKDGAWEFIRYFLTDEYQGNLSYEWPVSTKRLEEMAQAAMQKPYYMDENGNKVEYEDSYYIGGMEVPITPMTQEEVDTVMNFLKSLNRASTTDTSLMNIITEEAAAYFEGQKSPQEVAEIIQSRAQIYVNENR